MNRHRIAAFTVAAIVGLGGATALGQGSGSQQTPAQQAAALADALGVSSIDSARRMASFARIVGSVWTEDDQPVPYPHLVVRDLINGQVAGETTGTKTGEFRFEGLSAGAYVIELLGDSVPNNFSVGTAPASGGGLRFSGTNQGGSTDQYTAAATVEQSDRVLAVSPALTVVAGDTVGTFIRVSGSIRPGLIFGTGSSVFESADAARVGGAGLGALRD